MSNVRGCLRLPLLYAPLHRPRVHLLSFLLHTYVRVELCLASQQPRENTKATRGGWVGADRRNYASKQLLYPHYILALDDRIHTPHDSSCVHRKTRTDTHNSSTRFNAPAGLASAWPSNTTYSAGQRTWETGSALVEFQRTHHHQRHEQTTRTLNGTGTPVRGSSSTKPYLP